MSQPARDPIGDFQRWLMKAGARSLSREVADRVRTTIGGGASANKHASVWETATTEPPGDEPPECQWCPICRAARRYRDSGSTAAPDISSQLAGVGDVLAGFTKDAFSLFEAAVRNPQRPPGAPGSPNTPGADTPATPSNQTMAPSSGPESRGPPPLSMRRTRIANPPTKAATQRKTASPERLPPTAVAMSR
jgi:hypothetical protein